MCLSNKKIKIDCVSFKFPKKTPLVQQKAGKERKGKMQRKKNMINRKHRTGRQKCIYINNNKCRWIKLIVKENLRLDFFSRHRL